MRKKLHILHIPKWYPNPEDPQLGIFVRKQIQAASHLDTHSVLYVKSIKDLDSDYLIQEKIIGNVLELHIYYKKPESRTKQFFLVKKLYANGLKKIKKLISAPDLLHVHNLIAPAVWTYKYAKKHDIPWVLSEHWSGYTSQTGVFSSKMMWERKLWQWYSEKATCTIAVSSFLKEALIENGIGNKYYVIPNVVEGKLDEKKRDDKEIRILNVSDMVDDIKNISGLLKAFSVAIKSIPKLKLYLVGGGKDLDYLKDLSNELKLGSAVTFFGRLKNEEVLDIYQDIDFVVINSRVETFSVVAAESLYAGKPVISTRCGGVEEFINSENGILISKDDQIALEKAIKNMSVDCQKYDAKKLSNYSRKLFSSEAIGLSLSDIYHSII